MSCKTVPVPEAAAEAGLFKLAFCEDFENDFAIDFSGEGKPGYSFYVNRARRRPLLVQSQAEMRKSVLYLRPGSTMESVSICTCSSQTQNGFSMHFGYIEARIRVDRPLGRHNHWPKFWGTGKEYIHNENPGHRAELVVVEFTDPLDKGLSRSRGKDMIYVGTLHDHSWEKENGVWKHRLCTNSVNATGYNDQFNYVDTDWHTYGALWEPGHVAWYMDNELMHSVRFVGGSLPQYYYRDDPRPLPRIEERFPEMNFQVWEGAHTVTDRETMAFSLGCHRYWTMDVDWVRVWQ